MTEKQYAPTKTEKKVSQKTETPKKKAEQPKPTLTQKKPDEVKKEESLTDKKTTEAKVSEPKTDDEKKEKPEEKKKPQKPRVKKTEATVKGQNLPISTKYSAAVCRFIKNKGIAKAISELEDVLRQKKAVPVKGEIPHRKGLKKYASGSGKYPKKTSEHFIRLLKTLHANANYNEMENPVIFTAVANIGSRPYGKFGRWRRKRSHVKIIAKEKKELNKNKKKWKKEK